MMPDYCEPITAYRCWNAHANGLLVGQAFAEPWPPYQPMIARCGLVTGDGARAHLVDGLWRSAPIFACDCGIHALKRATAAEERLIVEMAQSTMRLSVHVRSPDHVPAGGRMWGAVSLWGRVIEHEIGYRAEFAYPSALWCEDRKLAAIVEALYGVPCLVKTLPKPDRREEDEWAANRRSFRGLVRSIYGPSFIPFTPPVYTPPSAQTSQQIAAAVPQPGLIQLASTAALFSQFQASKYQQQHAARTVAQQQAAHDWRDVMKKAFHTKPADDDWT